MVFILPDEGVSPYELFSSPERMREAFEGGQAGNGEVVWQIPKLDFGSTLDLADTLKKLGVNAAFERDADFSGITDHMAFISRIRQETHIAIDENGVEGVRVHRDMLCGRSTAGRARGDDTQPPIHLWHYRGKRHVAVRGCVYEPGSLTGLKHGLGARSGANTIEAGTGSTPASNF